MSLKDQGHRFCLSPDRQQARWLRPAIHAAMHADWLDVTDMDSDELASCSSRNCCRPSLKSAWRRKES